MRKEGGREGWLGSGRRGLEGRSDAARVGVSRDWLFASVKLSSTLPPTHVVRTFAPRVAPRAENRPQFSRESDRCSRSTPLPISIEEVGIEKDTSGRKSGGDEISSVVSCLDRWEKTEGRIESERIER